MAEWIAAGAIFGIKAFFAVFTFILAVFLLWGVIVAIAALAKGDDDEK